MESSNRLKLKEEVAYALPAVAISFLMGPIGIVQGIYAKYFGLELTTIAAVLLVARLFDGITDPIVGYWSDRSYAKGGSRKLFVVSGSV